VAGRIHLFLVNLDPRLPAKLGHEFQEFPLREVGPPE
jgi:hypothetical protein